MNSAGEDSIGIPSVKRAMEVSVAMPHPIAQLSLGIPIGNPGKGTIGEANCPYIGGCPINTFGHDMKT